MKDWKCCIDGVWRENPDPSLLEDRSFPNDRFPNGRHEDRLVCYSCKRMRTKSEFSFKSATRCIHCDKSVKIANAFRSRLSSVIGGRGSRRKLEKYLGCSIGKLIQHIESQFVDGMGWHNRSEWHIDHILPVCKFDHSNEDEIAECWHYSNLRPLWAHLNHKKGGRLNTGI